VAGEHGFQLGLSRRLFPDRDQFVFNPLPVQIFYGLPAGVTVFVGVKLEFHFYLIEMKKAAAWAASSKW
jgi:hypothetical protein